MELCQKAFAMAYDSLERVELPRRTVLRNIRLGLALKSLQMAAAAFVLWMLLRDATWVKAVEPTKMGVIAAWDDATDEKYNKRVASDLASPLCTSTERLDYVYSPKWRYENYTCVSPALSTERFIKEGDSMIFVPTSYEETNYQLVSAGGAADCSGVSLACAGGWQKQPGADLCKCSATTRHFVAGVEVLELAFDHRYEMSSGASNSLIDKDRESSQRSDVSCEKEGSCDVHPAREGKSRELKTVLVVKDASGQEVLLGVHDAPAPLSVPLVDIFAKAGLSLDSTSITNENMLLCSTPGADEQTCRTDLNKFPLVRQMGAALSVQLQYANRHLAHTLALPCGDCLDDHVGPVCKATISVEPGWNSRPSQDCGEPRRSATGEGSCTLRYSYGIKVKFFASGNFGVFDPIFIMVTIGAGVVYLAIPLVIINMLAVYFLGALSEVYRKADKEEVSLSSQLAGFVTRMITAQAAYALVTGGDDKPMTKHMLLERIKMCMENCGQQDLDEQEQIRLTELVMHALDKAGDGDIRMHEFVEAVSCNDPVSLKDAIVLFDQDRKLGFLEWLFTPTGWIKQVSCMFEKNTDGSYNSEHINLQVQTCRDGVASRSAAAGGLSPSTSAGLSPETSRPPSREQEARPSASESAELYVV